MRTVVGRIGLFAITFGISLIPLASPGQSWWFSGGPVVRGGMKASVDVRPTFGQTTAGFLGMPTPGEIGDLNNFADRFYDDPLNNDPSQNYVKIDSGTLDGAGGAPGITWNWGYNNGYNNAAQYQPAGGGTLSYLKQNAPTSSGDGDLLAAGLQLVVGLPLKQSAKWSVDLTFGFQGTWGANAKLRQSIGAMVDSYDVSAIPTDAFPVAAPPGFQGTFEGPFDDPPILPSPQIPNIPSTRTQTTVETVEFDVDQSLYQLSVGPQITYAASDKLRLNLRPTISANIIDVDVRRTEVFALPAALGGASKSWANDTGQRDVFFGVGVTGGADWDLGKGYFAGIFGGYEWVTQKMHVTAGPNTVTVDASGFVAGAMFGKRF